jgi:hypothetical protein
LKTKQLLFSLCLAALAAIVAISPVLAFPPLPSSFYGEIKANGQNVPEGTLVRALIAGKAYATSTTLIYQGNSVYRMDVAGDEADSSASEGGKEGDTIQFEVGGVIANETGVWHSGTNVNLVLTVTASKPLASPLPATPSKTTQAAVQAVVTPTSSASSSATSSGGSTNTGLVIGIIAAGAVIGGGAAWMLRRRKK